MSAPTEPKPPRARQIRPRVRVALVAIVEKGLKIGDAAETAGMRGESLRLALKRPHIQEELTRIKQAWLSNETGKAWLTVADLANGAASEDVRLKAARTILEAAGELGGKDKGEQMARTLVQILVGPASQKREMIVSDRGGVIEMPAFQLPAAAEADED